MCQREREWSGTVARIVVLLVLLAPAAAWAASEGGHEGGLISLDKSLIVQGVNFLILLFILQRLLYKPFLAKMEERTRRSRNRSTRRRRRARRRRASRRRTRCGSARHTPRPRRSEPRR